MRLVIDAADNRLTIGLYEVRGHHRWEAAVLALLVEGRHVSATTACPAARLHEVLRGHGQTRQLNRKQLSRLWVSLAAMFEAAGQAEALRERLSHLPRGRTVGPWWWSVRPGDEWQVVAGDATAGRGLRLPRLASQGDGVHSAALCQHALLCDALMIDGQLAAAEQSLLDETAWAQAAPELHAFRYLRIAECRRQRREFAAARQALALSRALCECNQSAAVYLAGAVDLMELRLTYAEDPVTHFAKIARALVPLLDPAATAHGQEVDRLTRGLALNLAALCERRAMEQHALRRGVEAARSHIDSAMAYWEAALYAFITSSQHEHAQNMCSNIGYFMHRAFEFKLQASPEPALRWYGVAQTLQNRFGLADNNVWEFIFLGDFWLYQPSVRSAFAALVSHSGWLGRRPDAVDFYEFAMQRAQEIGEPRQLAHTALNLLAFATEHRLQAVVDVAGAQLRATFRAHPEVRSILRSEGYRLP